MFCTVCVRAFEANLLHSQTRVEGAFIRNGLCNWKKGAEKLSKHEKSDCHQHALQKHLAAKQVSVSAVMDARVSQDKLSAQKALGVMFSSICYLGEQGFPTREESMLAERSSSW